MDDVHAVWSVCLSAWWLFPKMLEINKFSCKKRRANEEARKEVRNESEWALTCSWSLLCFWSSLLLSFGCSLNGWVEKEENKRRKFEKTELNNGCYRVYACGPTTQPKVVVSFRRKASMGKTFLLPFAAAAAFSLASSFFSSAFFAQISSCCFYVGTTQHKQQTRFNTVLKQQH